MRQTLVTPPAAEPVALSEAKSQCRVTSTAEDAYIAGLIEAARQHVEKQTGRIIAEQTWRLTLGKFANEITLPQSPLIAVNEVTYLDVAGASQTLSASVYTVDTTSTPGRIVLASDQDWPEVFESVNAVQIEYRAGYSTAPAALKHAILLLVGHWFAHREAVGETTKELPLAVDALLKNYRAYGFVA